MEAAKNIINYNLNMR